MSGHGDTDGTFAPGDIGALLDRANVLVNRGLDRYAQGDLSGALSAWREAQALLPENDLAGEYIEFVSRNFDVLAASADGDENARRAAAEMDVPFGLAADLGSVEQEDDEDDAYEMVVLEQPESEEDAALRETAAELARSLDAAAAIGEWLDDVDTGWVLPGDAVRALPPPPAAPAPPEADLEEALAEVSAGLMAGLDAVLAEEDSDTAKTFDLELSPAFFGEAAGEDPAGSDDAAASGGSAVEADTGEATAERSANGSAFDLGPAGVDATQTAESSQGDDAEESEEPTVELHAHAMSISLPGDDEVTVPGGEEPPPFNPGVYLSDDALAALSVPGDGASPEEPTAERPSVGRFPLSELAELEGATPRDDRAGVDDDLQPEIKVSFRSPAGPSATRELGDDEPTVDRGMMVSLDDEEQTIERGGGGTWSASAPATARAPTVDPLLPSTNVIVDDHLLAEMDETGEHQALLDPGHPAELEFRSSGSSTTRELGRPAAAMSNLGSNFGVAARVPTPQPSEVAEGILEELGRTVIAGEFEDDRIRRRVTALIQRGADEDRASNPAVAATAIDLALAEQPDSIVAQKVIHRHRDLVIEIFEHYIGDVQAIPTLALPMHEIPQQALDNRAAFLLSRIDGSITFDEILDVAGMTQLEALRLLCKMLLTGILHVG